MAVRIVLGFERVSGAERWRSSYVAAYCLRGRWCRSFNGKLVSRVGRYGLAVPAPRLGEDSPLQAVFSLPTDAWTEPLLETLVTLGESARAVRIGLVVARLLSLESVDEVTSADLVKTAPVTMVEVAFATLTRFAAGDRRSRGIVDPGLVVKSWAASWNGKGKHTGPSTVAIETGVICPDSVVTELGSYLEPIAGTLSWDRTRFTTASKRSRRGAEATGAGTLRAPRSVYG